MGNKIQRSPLDQNILDKLMEETGLEREVIIAWRFVREAVNRLNYDDFILFLENNFYCHLHRVKWAGRIFSNSIVRFVLNRKIKLKKLLTLFLQHLIAIQMEKLISQNFFVSLYLLIVLFLSIMFILLIVFFVMLKLFFKLLSYEISFEESTPSILEEDKQMHNPIIIIVNNSFIIKFL